jgi:hypothetical protein
MGERRRNKFERKCRVCGSLGVPTADGRVMHFGRIATCREHPVVEGDADGVQITVDGLVPTATTIHPNGDVQGVHGQSGRSGIVASRKAGKTAAAQREVAELRAQGFDVGVITPYPDQPR